MKIIFAGTPDFAATILQAVLTTKHEVVAVYTQPDKPAGRGQKMLSSAVKQLAIKHQLPVFQPKTLRDIDAQQALSALQADVMIVAAYGLILPQAVLDMPRYGCLNVHASLLPRWRGAAPIQRAILAGDTKTGVTIMQMEASLDTGPMLRKMQCDISATDTSQLLHDKLAELGATALLATLNDLQCGQLQPEIQNSSLANYAHKIEKEEAKIDWQQAASTLVRQVYAFNPWPIARTQLDDQSLRVWHAKAMATPTTAAPGTIIHTDKTGIDIATGLGILRLQTVQLPGHKAMQAADMLNGHSHLFTVGKKLS